MKDRQGRRLVFITFSGEELGLLGSRYYCNKQPLFPLADTVAMVNLDMVGRLKRRQGNRQAQAARRRRGDGQGLWADARSS